MSAGELLELADEFSVSPAGQVVVEALLDGGQLGPFQPRGLGVYEGRVDDVREGRPAPLRQSLPRDLRSRETCTRRA